MAVGHLRLAAICDFYSVKLFTVRLFYFFLSVGLHFPPHLDFRKSIKKESSGDHQNT